MSISRNQSQTPAVRKLRNFPSLHQYRQRNSVTTRCAASRNVRTTSTGQSRGRKPMARKSYATLGGGRLRTRYKVISASRPAAYAHDARMVCICTDMTWLSAQFPIWHSIRILFISIAETFLKNFGQNSHNIACSRLVLTSKNHVTNSM